MVLRFAQRRAFSLIEVLIVIAIVAIVFALVVPAVQKVRTAAVRTQCGDNVRNLGLACLKFHDIRKHLPQGGRNAPGVNPHTGKPYTHALDREDFSWCYHLLPYIGQGELQERSDAGVCTTPIPLFYCPARRTVRLYHEHAICDYAGNGGTNNVNGTILITGPVKLTLRGITDGTASALLLGERRVNLALIEGTEDKHDNESCMNPGYDGDVIRWASRSTVSLGVAPDISDPAVDPATVHHCFGSSHDFGMNALFADGSLRTIAYSIEPRYFRFACVRDDSRNFNHE